MSIYTLVTGGSLHHLVLEMVTDIVARLTFEKDLLLRTDAAG